MTPAARTAPADDCLLFLTHHVRPGAMKSLEEITRECSPFFDIFPIIDQTHEQFPIGQISSRANAVTAAQLEERLPYRKKQSQHPGTLWPNNIDLPVLWFFKENPDYSYYWLIEYDVRYSGRWSDFFLNFSDNQSDLLAISMFDHEFRPGWAHWSSFSSPTDIPLAERVRATLSFYRLSNRALHVLDQAYRDGATGHYEVAIPTILKHVGLTIEDMGGSGAYVAPGNHNRHYINSPQNPGLAPGTFVLHAEDMIKQPIPNMLWNPFKD